MSIEESPDRKHGGAHQNLAIVVYSLDGMRQDANSNEGERGLSTVR